MDRHDSISFPADRAAVRPSRQRPKRSTRRLVALAVAAGTVAAAGIGWAGAAAAAQEGLPTGPALDDAPNPGSAPNGIDFGDAVTVD